MVDGKLGGIFIATRNRDYLASVLSLLDLVILGDRKVCIWKKVAAVQTIPCSIKNHDAKITLNGHYMAAQIPW